MSNSKTCSENFSILVCEDDEGLATLVVRLLNREGYRASSVGTGKDAIKALQSEHDYNLLIIDYFLPDLNGFEVVSQLKDRDYLIPYVVVTGFGDEKIAVEMMKLGARDYIVKDENFLNLLPSVIKLVANSLLTEKNLLSARETIVEARKQFSQLFQNSMDPVFVITSKGELVEYNNALRTLTGYSDSELESLKISGLCPTHNDATGFIQRSVKRNINSSESLTIVHKDKSEKQCLLTSSLWRSNDSEPNNYLCILKDISERIVAEQELKRSRDILEAKNQELLELNKSLKTFSDSVTNDLRAPLWRIDGFCQVLFDKYNEKLDDTGQRYLNQISKDSLRITQFINDTLHLSRVIEGAVTAKRIDLTEIIRDIIRNDFANTSSTFIKRINIEDDITAEADSRLMLIMWRILLYSVRDLADNQQEAEIKIFCDRKDRSSVIHMQLLNFNIESSTQSQEFVPLYYAHLVKDFSHTGIGLVSVQRIVQLHGGKIWSELEGTVLDVCLTLD